MEDIQTIKFSSGSSNMGFHTVEEMSAGIGTLNMSSQFNSFSICSPETVVKLDPTMHTSGSSAIATRNITNYPWDLMYIPGTLVAVHSSGNYIAYAIKDPSFPSGIMRIISRRTALRGLIKNIPGFITDLAFAYLSSRILLAFTDQYGTLFVYEIHEEEENLRTQLLMQVKRDDDEEASDHQRVIWCPFIPDDPDEEEDQDECDDENFAYLLVVTNGPLAEIWHIMTMIQLYGVGSIDHSRVKPGQGHQVMEKHLAPISDAAFSPDGTALATASLDGYVKFFQIYMSDNQKSPRCLHQWNPHDRKPLTSLFFLDNHKNPTPDVQFWKYAVTGACDNTEIKVWSCETWQCTQVIRFEHPDNPDLESLKLSFKAAIDSSSRYLILSDIYRRALYVLVIYQETNTSERACNGDAIDSAPQSHSGSKVGMAGIVSISEFLIQYPTIFLTITNAGWKSYKRWKHEHLGQDAFREEDADEENDDMDVVEGLIIKCVLINTKSLQDATIRFQPVLPLTSNFEAIRSPSRSAGHNLNSSQSSIVVKDGLTDLSLNLSSTISEVEMNTDGEAAVSRKTSEVLLEKNNVMVSLFPSFSSSSKAVLGTEGSPSVSSSVSTSCNTSSLPSGVSETANFTSPSLVTHGTSIASVIDCSVSSQPVTMNLLTPESFSSPGKIEEIDLMKNEEMKGADDKKEIFHLNAGSPSEDLKSAALSLFRRVSKPSSCLQSTETSNAAGTLNALTSQNTERISKNILETVVAGSSRSPSVNKLPPPPRTGPSPLPDKEDAPLATSEMTIPVTSSSNPCSEAADLLSSDTLTRDISSQPIPHVASGIGPASSTSSPSLEVQQILLSHNRKTEHAFADEEELGLEDTQNDCANGTSQTKSATSTSPSLQELINIASGSKKAGVPKAHSSSVPHLIDMFTNLKSFPTPVASQLPHLMSSSIKQTSPSCETLVTSASHSSEALPPSNKSFVRKESSPLIPLLIGKNSLSKTHITCEQLEAEIKAASPTQNKPEAVEMNSCSASSSSLSTLVLPADLGASSQPCQNTVSNAHNDVRSETLNAIDSDRQEKILEELAALRNLIVSCHGEHYERMEAFLDQAKTLSNQADKSLKCLHQHSKAIEELRKSVIKLQEQIPSVIASTTKPAIENCIRHEIRNCLTPSVNRCIEPLRSQLSTEVRNLVSNSEIHITDSLTKAACSRTFIDNLSASVASALSVSVQSACRDAYNKVVVPGFNAITQQVFSQLNEAFTRGTKEYMQHVENESQAARNALMDSVSTNSRTLEATSATLSTHVTSLMDAYQKHATQQTALSETLGERLRHLVHEELVRALQEHQAALEARTSRSQTPLPSSALTPTNPKVARQHLQQLISQRQYNVAFKEALSASDLSLVVFLCERINPQQLFSQSPCLLTQDVLLSLVNQLSHDLPTFTDLKTKYLEEAVMNLDMNHPVTREHMRPVLQEFQRSLSAHLEKNPNHKKLKMLLLAVNHLVAS